MRRGLTLPKASRPVSMQGRWPSRARPPPASSSSRWMWSAFPATSRMPSPPASHLKRSQFLLNASHTHTGPIVWPNLRNLTVLPPGEQEKLEAYARTFTDALVNVIGAAVADLAPADHRLW